LQLRDSLCGRKQQQKDTEKCLAHCRFN